ncbi:MAG: 30S ribosomal protein S6 [Planctomycetota bacterium]|nr:30S ribosomal protein S6 [Planctomycetota bacterium]MDA1179221.1 30S ribosomal protein S6 [Planctomycetota bacterium]
MSAHVYECMFLLDSNRYARDPSGVSAELNSMVEQSGGTILVSRLWNEQKLAYPIDGHKKGTYWLSYFRLESSRQQEIVRKFRLNEAILRQLILKVDPRIADALVQHAAGGSVSLSAAVKTAVESKAPLATATAGVDP